MQIYWDWLFCISPSGSCRHQSFPWDFSVLRLNKPSSCSLSSPAVLSAACSVHYVNIFFALEPPNLHSVLQMWSYKCWIEGANEFPWLFSCDPVSKAQYAVGFLCFMGTRQFPPLVSSFFILKLFPTHLPSLNCVRVSLPQRQDFCICQSSWSTWQIISPAPWDLPFKEVLPPLLQLPSPRPRRAAGTSALSQSEVHTLLKGHTSVSSRMLIKMLDGTGPSIDHLECPWKMAASSTLSGQLGSKDGKVHSSPIAGSYPAQISDVTIGCFKNK